MLQARRWRGLILGAALLAGCAGPGPDPFPSLAERSSDAKDAPVVAVLPLSGHAAVRRGAGEWLAYKLQAEARSTVLSPGFAEAKLASSEAWGGERTTEEIVEVGRALGAAVVVAGSIRFAARWQTPRIDLRIVDVSSKKLAVHVTEDPALAAFVHDPYELAQIAVEQAARKTLVLLNENGWPGFQPASAQGRAGAPLEAAARPGDCATMTFWHHPRCRLGTAAQPMSVHGEGGAPEAAGRPDDCATSTYWHHPRCRWQSAPDRQR